ncbi:MAG: hypothetical protein LW847_16245 [Burkholderiales bacterium]|jgi:hypothetical protein|nr:hypothetical protein [Burkholderiales bacterium]
MSNNTIPVTVSVSTAGNGGPRVTCNPDPVTIFGRPATVLWTLDAASTGWKFKEGDKAITIQGPNAAREFYDYTTSTDGRTLTVADADDNSAQYNYTLHLKNASGAEVDFDPSIRNSGQ